MNTKRRKNKTRICFNVSGHIYETWDETLARFPDTLLGEELSRSRFYNSDTGERFLNLDFCRSVLGENILSVQNSAKGRHSVGGGGILFVFAPTLYEMDWKPL